MIAAGRLNSLLVVMAACVILADCEKQGNTCELNEPNSDVRSRVGLLLAKNPDQRKTQGTCFVSCQLTEQPGSIEEKQLTIERVSVPLQQGKPLVIEFVRIPKGRFLMGSTDDELKAAIEQLRPDLRKYYDEHQHEVEITRDYWLGRTAVTRGQFKAFVEDEGYLTDAEKDGRGSYSWCGTGFGLRRDNTWRTPGFDQTDDHPVVLVSWGDSVAFCKWVKKKTGKEVCLPTEAEWERACRGGERKGRFSFGDDADELVRHANVADASLRAIARVACIKADDGYAFTSPVGKFLPNQYGLYDMHGNVCQWCSDWFAEDYYSHSGPKDPGGPDSGLGHVLRGGSYMSSPFDCRAANRLTAGDHRYGNLGFRLCFH